MNKKIVALVLVCVLIFSTVVAGTLAYLQTSTQKVTNTFTFGSVNITLTENEGTANGENQNDRTFKLLPGQEIKKDPTITVKAGSESSYIFVKLDKVNNPDTYLTYSIDSTVWTALPGVDGVYYKTDAVAQNNEDDTVIPVLTDNAVTCKNGITKDQMDTVIASGNYPKLEFTAYAVQTEGFATAAEAWDATFGA